MKPRLSNERGQALILITFAAIALFAISGLAIDGSNKLSDRRHAQNAADTAALSAGLVKTNLMTAGQPDEICSTTNPLPWTTYCDTIIDAAWAQAGKNGYDGMLSNNVEVFSPPIDGPYKDQTHYIQVKITSRVDTYFMRVLGIDQAQNIVEATSMSGKGGYLGDGAMLISYDPTPGCSSGVGSGGGSFDISGDSTINLKGGGIFVNSKKSCGYYAPNCPNLTITGGAGINSAAQVDNIEQNDSICASKVTLVPESIKKTAIQVPEDISIPSEPPECNITPTADYLGVDVHDGKGEWLIHPGYYEVFPQANLVANKQHIYMASGVYCIDPGGLSHDFDLSWSPTDFVTLNGSTNPSKNKYHAYNPDGVTLYIRPGGGFSINANNPTFLDASADGDYQGYLIIQAGNKDSIENCSITGGADIDLNGAIFAPYCNITVNGQSSSVAEINAQLIGWDLKIDGKAGINFNYDPDKAVKIKRKVGLMK